MKEVLAIYTPWRPFVTDASSAMISGLSSAASMAMRTGHGNHDWRRRIAPRIVLPRAMIASARWLRFHLAYCRFLARGFSRTAASRRVFAREASKPVSSRGVASSRRSTGSLSWWPTSPSTWRLVVRDRRQRDSLRAHIMTGDRRAGDQTVIASRGDDR
jgi:hypothetical protein